MAESAPVFHNVLDAIGNTPMHEVTKIDTGPCRLFLKLENQNPGGSIKDRIGLSMILAAEADGAIKPGGTLIEATAGNTGLGLALVAAQKGYKLVIVVPDKMAQEKIFHLKAMGSEVITTRSDVGKGHPEYYQDMAERQANENGWFYVNQFGNPATRKRTGRRRGLRSWPQLKSAGTGLMRLCAVSVRAARSPGFRSVSRNIRRTPRWCSPTLRARSWRTISRPARFPRCRVVDVEGIGEDFLPPICDLSRTRNSLYCER